MIFSGLPSGSYCVAPETRRREKCHSTMRHTYLYLKTWQLRKKNITMSLPKYVSNFLIFVQYKTISDLHRQSQHCH